MPARCLLHSKRLRNTGCKKKKKIFFRKIILKAPWRMCEEEDVKNMKRLEPTRSDKKSPGERIKSPGKGECGNEDREKAVLEKPRWN